MNHQNDATLDVRQHAEGRENSALLSSHDEIVSRNVAREVAKIFGVSERTVRRNGAWVARLEKHPDLLREVEHGRMTQRESVLEMDKREGMVRDEAAILAAKIQRLERQLNNAVAEYVAKFAGGVA